MSNADPNKRVTIKRTSCGHAWIVCFETEHIDTQVLLTDEEMKEMQGQILSLFNDEPDLDINIGW